MDVDIETGGLAGIRGRDIPYVVYDAVFQFQGIVLDQLTGLLYGLAGEYGQYLVPAVARRETADGVEIPVGVLSQGPQGLQRGLRPKRLVEDVETNAEKRRGRGRLPGSAPQHPGIMHLEGLPGEKASQLVLETVEAPQEFVDHGDVLFEGLLVRPLKAHASFPEDDDPIGDEEHVGDIVAYHDGGETVFLSVMDDHTQDHVLPDGVLACRRLVEKDYLGVGDKRACQGHPFLHTPRQLRREFSDRLQELQVLYPLHRPLLYLRLRQVRRLTQGKGDVLEHGHRVEEGVVLEQVGYLVPVSFPLGLLHFVDGGALEEDGAFVRLEKADDVLEEHALAGAALADDRGDLVLVDAQVDVVQHRPAVEPLRNVPELYERSVHIRPYIRNDVTT
ncbi:MAG: hypothetical protein A4E61_00801 [Syntrophorhabdus sp. PtaB.Bin184]|nr:MAG: hypothetical protein A4E61_00801 [Syntrophorhabdus sp. PtaB.Bin184]